MAFSCFYKTIKKEAVELIVVPVDQYQSWLEQQEQSKQNMLKAQSFKAISGKSALFFNSDGELSAALIVIDTKDMWSMSSLCQSLPHGDYQITDPFDVVDSELFYLAFGLGCYQFLTYKSDKKTNTIKLYLPKKFAEVEKTLRAIYLVRDMINTPAADMGPEEIARQTQKLAQTFSATFSEIVGDDLLTKGYRGIHAVGRASARAPRRIRLDWGNEAHPHIVLVGKGVVFDTGGLDIKPASGMLLMHKDMGGSAQVLGLARLIMDTQLPVRLTVLISAVENAISGNAYRPSDVIKMYNGTTVEVTNTDAEGRIVLADILTEATREKPSLVMDFATLTGAARIAVGTEMSAFFANDEDWAHKLSLAAEKVQDPVWRMPLYASYRKLLDSQVADIKNCASVPYAGSISAALFLQSFIEHNTPWLHFDLMAWNISNMPGRMIGGEAMGIRAAYEMLKAHLGV